MPKIRIYPRLVIGFILFIISGVIFGQLFLDIKFLKQLTVNSHKPRSSITSAELLNFTHPSGSYSFNFPGNWNLLYLTPDENTLMVAPQEKIDAVSKQAAGFGTSPELVITIAQTTTKPTIRSDNFWGITSKESITIDSTSGTKNIIEIKKDNSGFTKGSKLINIVIPHQQTYLDIQLLDATYEDTFNKIIESFKLMEFVESTPSPTPHIQPSQSPEASAAASPL